MKLSSDSSDVAVLGELGARLARLRLDRELTQAQLAREAGVSKRTVERIESGASAQLSSLVRVLRTLDLLSALDQLIPEPRPSPIELLRSGRRRKRAPRAPGEAGDRHRTKPWKWGDES